MVETCGLGNWTDIGRRLNRDEKECRNHLEWMYFSPSFSSLSLFFSSLISSRRSLTGEDEVNSPSRHFSSSSLIYPLMSINPDEQKCLTYMPLRDEYEREFNNQAETRLPSQLTAEDQDTSSSSSSVPLSSECFLLEEDRAKVLLHQAKWSLCRSYGQILRRRFQLKHFIRDYSLAFEHQQQEQQQFVSLFAALHLPLFLCLFFRFDLHQISRFLSADQYERLIYNHRSSSLFLFLFVLLNECCSCD